MMANKDGHRRFGGIRKRRSASSRRGIGARIWPLRHCRRCAGLGKHRSPSARKYRRCDGTGYRTRTGRRVINTLCSTCTTSR